MQRQEAPLADNVAAKIDVDIRLLAEVLRDPRLPVARVDKIDNAEGNIIDMFLVVFTKQPPAFRHAAQAVNFPQRCFTWGGVNTPYARKQEKQPAAQ